MGSGGSGAAERTAARQLLREFLRSVPRAQAGETVTLPRPGGGVCVVSRGQVSTAVDTLRPRLRQVARLLYEDHWHREDVAKRLLVSLDTVERDQALALDQVIRALCSRWSAGWCAGMTT
jgi:DNA-directed RNA polymerase specialized sigma24 family protein